MNSDEASRLAEFVEGMAEEVRKGWCQRAFGAWRVPEGPVCLLGAGLRSFPQTRFRLYPNCEHFGDWDQFLANRLHDMNVCPFSDDIGDAHTPTQWCVSAWNDDPHRTQDEVVDFLLNTAKDLRNGS